jgi:lipid-binding SYLF domain-containing protein
LLPFVEPARSAECNPEEDENVKPIRILGTVLLLIAVLASMPARPALAASASELTREARQALKDLYASSSAAKGLSAKAKGILVFPSVVKAGFLIAGQIGEGVLFKNGKPVAYYNTVAGSYGLQAGGQVFGYALFFMNNDALAYLDKSSGWDVGAGPSLVVVDKGMGKSITGTTLTHDVYAFIFNQKGLMGGLGLQGSKITKISK